jgi:hypothetical protein
MGSQESELMMDLLKELASIKEQDAKHQMNPSQAELEAHKQRRQRREEITELMKSLAEQTKQ